MDLNAVAIFVSVVETGSFVDAARVTKLSKSTVARRIDELESSLGVRLLQRSTRTSQLTEAGRSFYERCRRIVDDIDDAVSSVTTHQREPKGLLRFSASVLLGERFLSELLVEYLRRYPDVELDLHLAARRMDLIADGFDLVLRVGRLESSSHIVRRLAPAPSYVCASPAYLQQHGTPEHPDDLRQHAGILFSPDRVPPIWVLDAPGERTASIPMRGRLMVNSHPVAMEACEAGLGLAELPAMVCCDALRTGRLVRVLPEWQNDTRWLHALYPSRRHIPAALRTFLDFLVASLTPPPWIDP
ncbi:MAG: LysR family transcriptional regulator [Myxococcales bacterium]|nr:LysR family transcriptional regulator [Myxococcales bacterium]